MPPDEPLTCGNAASNPTPMPPAEDAPATAGIGEISPREKNRKEVIAMARKLTVVTNETKPVPVTIKDAVTCSERDLLVALRKKAAGEIDAGVPPHVLAPLMRQLRELDKEIRALDAREVDADDDGDISTDFDASAI